MWTNVSAPLEAAGVRVTAIDLPAHTITDNQRAGMTITAVAEQVPEKIAALPPAKVYTLDADHIPMMSATQGVVDALLEIRSLQLTPV